MSSESTLQKGTTIPLDYDSTREALEKLIRNITTDSALYDDLLQEASVHLWLTQTRRPGQTPSWYLQSCRFHLQHYLASGRSVDSNKRRSGQLHFTQDTEEEDGIPEQGDAGNSVINSVSVRELLSLLSPHLSETENAVLECLADGLGPREIGRELSMSHTMVIRHRRRIASLVERLEAGNTEVPRLNGNRSFTARVAVAIGRVRSTNGAAVAFGRVEMACRQAA